MAYQLQHEKILLLTRNHAYDYPATQLHWTLVLEIEKLTSKKLLLGQNRGKT
jgi:hypothetical protein